MVEELQKGFSKLKLGGEKKRNDFPFMDICGFTRLSAKPIRIEMTLKD